MYNGTICLPHVPLPSDHQFNIGDNITIQVIELAQMLRRCIAYAPYSSASDERSLTSHQCADVTLADPKHVPYLNTSTCFNSSNIDFISVYTTARSSDAGNVFVPSWIGVLMFSALAVVMGYGL